MVPGRRAWPGTRYCLGRNLSSRGINPIMPNWFAYTLIVLLVITSILLTLLILLHRGKGGGMSSMFGGGVSSSLAGSSVAEKNLDRYTVLVGIVWFACIVGLGLWLRLALPSS
jgi:preprotein translocase subunit SecG